MILVHSRVNRLLMQVTDGLVGVLAFILAHLIRTFLLEPIVPFELPNIGTLADYSIFFPFIAIAGPFILYRLNFYNLTLSQRSGNLINLTFQGGLVLFILLVVLQFMFKVQMSRIIFVIFVPTYALMIFGREYLIQMFRARRASQNKDLRNMIVITDRNDRSRWQTRMQQRPQFGFQVCRTIAMPDFNVVDLINYLHEHSVELVVFDIKSGELSKIMDGIRACEEEGIETWFSTGFFETQITEPTIDTFNNQTFMIFRATPDSSWQLFFKELIDRFGSLALLIAASPIMLLCALLVKLTSDGPILFQQRRSGHYGKPFTMYKFRSMVTNAEQRKEELRAFNEMSGPVFKVTGDPRITPVGHWLRRTSLDELPQLFNVLKGEMSLVGPRPLPVDETLAISENAQRRRLSVKPGLTCLWQIGGRNQVHSFEDWVKLDLEYIDTWSLALDIKILLKTIPVVLFFKGAK
jgi:exopolysaccharide biosynthesis polyprenyl glycosylphosphotransferase